jgi:hypothetical protein
MRTIVFGFRGLTGRSSGLRLTTCIVTILLFGFGDVVLSQNAGSPMAPRPFPVVHVSLGDKLLAIPQQWLANGAVKIREGRQPYISFVNADLPQFSQREDLRIPQLSLFALTQVPQELSESNLRQQRAELEKRWPGREPDDHGFWRWKTTEFVSISDATHRPLGQPLIVKCRSATPEPKDALEDRCSVRFYWTLLLGVQYDFKKTKFPEADWVGLDRRVLEFLRFLDADEVVHSGR